MKRIIFITAFIGVLTGCRAKQVEVELLVCPTIDNETSVRILLKPVLPPWEEPKLMYEVLCYSGGDVEMQYARMKNYMFDTMPRKISQKWCFEHGYWWW